ncbi:MAG: CehA/McbA family metallohydrolase [Deltaproteobacteria bacterium]|nr:MAG: CehA/McbA family metallohydrolase [Deltaproteobacteria bacterium]
MQNFTTVKKSLSLMVFALLVVLFCSAVVYAAPSAPMDAASIQQSMQELIDFLDSPKYKEMVTWEEHIVLTYRLVKNRMPTSLEFFLLGASREDIGLKRSTVLSIVLRDTSRHPSWNQCRAFLQRVGVSDFRVDQEVTEQSQKLNRVPLLEILKNLIRGAQNNQSSFSEGEPRINLPVPYVQYNVYYGYLHAHSELSDGQGSPASAYESARNNGLDYFALTDHGEFLIIWPWDNKWERLVEAAKDKYQPGNYVTLWGFEWSNPILGHINVINTADFTNTFSDFWVTNVYDWIIDRPAAFALFNHPGDYDFLSLELRHLRRYPAAVPQIVGIETWNGNNSFDFYYYDGNWFGFLGFISYWDLGNWRGWYLGAQGGQDNHSTDWGLQNEFRTAVLAERLTRKSIIEAYRNRRFYATEDKNLYLDLRCQGYPMGSRLSGVPRQFEVTASDGGGDTFSEIRLYRSGILWQSKVVSGSNFQETLTDPFPFGKAYYYVIVTQEDDNDGNGRNDEAISSPIWIE